MTQNSSRPSAGAAEKIVAGAEQARKDLGERLGGTLTLLDRTARAKAPQVRDKVSASLGKAAHTLEKAGRKLPEPARGTAVRTTRQAIGAAGRRPGALAAVAGVCAAAGLLLWRRKRQS